jgi:cyclopropane-fatty-acyl-phospholipid synthase
MAEHGASVRRAKLLRQAEEQERGAGHHQYWQVKFADAYLAGDIDIDGDMLRPFELRHTMGDLHPLMTAWRFLQPLLLRQVRANKAAITSNYEIDADFFLSFLDPRLLLHAEGFHECGPSDA